MLHRIFATFVQHCPIVEARVIFECASEWLRKNVRGVADKDVVPAATSVASWAARCTACESPPELDHETGEARWPCVQPTDICGGFRCCDGCPLESDCWPRHDLPIYTDRFGDYCKIPLTKGQFAKVDPEDYIWLSQFRWHCKVNKDAIYAVRTIQENGRSQANLPAPPPDEHAGRHGLRPHQPRRPGRPQSQPPQLHDRPKQRQPPQLADITYIRLTEGWLYLAVILDCFSRRIVGWSLSRQIDAELVCAALEMALRRRCPQGDLVHHSDRGVQYASQALREPAATGGADDEHVPQRGPVGQRHDGELLRIAQDRVDRHRLCHGSPGANGGIQVHRDVL